MFLECYDQVQRQLSHLIKSTVDNHIHSLPLFPKMMKFGKALADSKISLLLSTLLQLVPRFIDKVAQIIAKNKTEEVVVYFKNPTHGVALLRACVEKGGTTGALNQEEMETGRRPSSVPLCRTRLEPGDLSSAS